MITKDIIVARERLLSSLTRIGEQGGKALDLDRMELGIALTALGMQEIAFNYKGGSGLQHFEDVSAKFFKPADEVDHALALVSQISAQFEKCGPTLAQLSLGVAKPMHLSFINGGSICVKVPNHARSAMAEVSVTVVGSELPRPQ